ncbi:hypothetical protein AB0E81_31720 [Streptomyces sp. NPDC033538]|uniref:hypothetical protein n=1 Tax=Streptomyces sp. NPDC033538 TaxID=3155367 RepID=UPI0033C14605
MKQKQKQKQKPAPEAPFGGDLPTAEALLELGDAALAYSTPGIPRPDHPASDATADGNVSEARQLHTTLRTGAPVPYWTQGEAVHASREVAEAFQAWRETPMGRELTASSQHPRVAAFRQAWQRLPAADLPDGPGTAAGPYGDVGRSAQTLVERAEAANAQRAPGRAARPLHHSRRGHPAGRRHTGRAPRRTARGHPAARTRRPRSPLGRRTADGCAVPRSHRSDGVGSVAPDGSTSDARASMPAVTTDRAAAHHREIGCGPREPVPLRDGGHGPLNRGGRSSWTATFRHRCGTPLPSRHQTSPFGPTGSHRPMFHLPESVSACF